MFAGRKGISSGTALAFGRPSCMPRRRWMLRILLWIVGIIFLIGLLVVTGVFSLIF
jgi:hypothetical protein